MITYSELARLIGLNQKQLDNFVNFSDKHYQSYYIKKKDKKRNRYINSPSPKLKAIQRWILHNILYNIDVSSRANGFIKMIFRDSSQL